MGEGMNAFFGLDPPRKFAGDDYYFVNGFGNTAVIDTGEGLVLFDLGLGMAGEKLFQAVRAFSREPVAAIILSHGHFDHAFGFAPFIEEILANGWEMPNIVAHRNVPRRFEKYQRLGPYHAWINAMQFSAIVRGRKDAVVSAENPLEPTTLVKEGEPVSFTLGRYTFEVHPARGETDDALWVHVPKAKVILAGDLVISSFPNVGNPYKVQRYPLDWAEALEAMLPLGCEYLVPGHGDLIEGAARVRACLSDTAGALRFVHDAVVSRMNERKWFPEIYQEVIDGYPARFKESEFLREIYGDLRFAIHCTHRLYHGWYNTGNPADLFPSPAGDVAREVVALAGEGGPARILDRARVLLDAGSPQLAMHLLDFLLLARDAGTPAALAGEAAKMKVKALQAVARQQSSFIARNVLENEARALKARGKEEGPGGA